ncbi:MAG: hypothetical protein K2L08_03525 [Erysipelotrichaceae bacterium]|nr:hypothetical protein [Erysipelotrichaceae bacterium]
MVSKMMVYLRKNIVFIILLSIIIVITTGLTVYYAFFVKVDNISNIEENVATPEHKTAKVQDFKGYYGSDNQVYLSWNIIPYQSIITSVALYHQDVMIADVSNLKHYTLPQDVYKFPGGENVFSLHVQLKDEEMVRAETTVMLDHLTSVKCISTESEEGMLVTLSYRHRKDFEVAVPRITVNASSSEYHFSYKDTTKTEDGDFIVEETTYEINTRNAQASKKVTIRWIFDSLNRSFDFPLEIKIKSGQ